MRQVCPVFAEALSGRLLLMLLTCFLGSSAQNATAQTFENPLFTSQDPWVVHVGGLYYYSESNTPNKCADQVCLRVSPSLTGLATAAVTPVWTPPATCSGVGANCHDIWSPRIVSLNGHWYIYYSADDGNNVNHRTFVLQASDDSKPLGSYYVPNNGQPNAEITTPDNHWAINAIPFTASDGKLYLVWSGQDGCCGSFPQNSYIAGMSDPLHTTGARVLIGTPNQSWETRTAAIQEGQSPFVHNGVNFINYSASASWTTDYSVGLLTNRTGNLLDPASWTKSGPIFDHTAESYGPGSSVLVTSPDGSQTWNLYHAIDQTNCQPNAYACRDIRMQQISWNADNSPNFGTVIDPYVAQTLPSGDMGQGSDRRVIATATDNNGMPWVLWDLPSGGAQVWKLSADGSKSTQQTGYGPFADWKAIGLTVGQDNVPWLLWRKLDGTISLWRLKPDGSMDTARDFDPAYGWQAVGMGEGPNNMPWVAWQQSDGHISLWHMNADFTYAAVNFGPFGGWSLKGVAVGPDNQPRLLWTYFDGTASIWNLSSNGAKLNGPNSAAPSGFTAQSIAVDNTGTAHVLWSNVSGALSLWSMDGNGIETASQTQGPFSGWAPIAIGGGNDTLVRLLWQNLDGTLSFWTMHSDDTRVSATNFNKP